MKRTQLKRKGGLGQGNGFKKQSKGLSTKSTFKKKPPSLKMFTEERQVIEDEYKIAKKEAWDRDGGLCTGCKTADRLSPSHLIPRSDRPDLIAVVKNIRWQCMDGDDIEGCHTKHEMGKWDELLDGDEIREIMQELDEEYYNRITV